MKKLIVCSLLIISMNAHAGFVLGYLAGSSQNSSDADSQQVIVSDNHDVITCCREDLSTVMCSGPYDSKRNSRAITPQQFAGNAGYKTLNKIGFLSRRNGCDMIIMEVSGHQ